MDHVLTTIHDCHTIPHSQLTEVFLIYTDQLQIRFVIVQLGVGVQPPQPQPPPPPHGADLVVTVNVPRVPPMPNVAVVVELYEEAEVSFIFILSQLYAIQVVATKSQVLFI